MGVGSLSMIVPMYNAEIAPPEVRGALVALQQLSITLGIMVSFWIDYGTVSFPRHCAVASSLFLTIMQEFHRRHGQIPAQCCLAPPSLPSAGARAHPGRRHDIHALLAPLAGSPRP